MSIVSKNRGSFLWLIMAILFTFAGIVGLLELRKEKNSSAHLGTSSTPTPELLSESESFPTRQEPDRLIVEETLEHGKRSDMPYQDEMMPDKLFVAAYKVTIPRGGLPAHFYYSGIRVYPGQQMFLDYESKDSPRVLIKIGMREPSYWTGTDNYYQLKFLEWEEPGKPIFRIDSSGEAISLAVTSGSGSVPIRIEIWKISKN